MRPSAGPINESPGVRVGTMSNPNQEGDEVPDRYEPHLGSAAGLESAIRDLARRLAEYEGSNLRPEELVALREILKHADRFLTLMQIEVQYPGSLNSLARLHTTMNNLGIIGSGLQRVVMYMAIFIGAIISFKSGFVAWIAAEIAKK